MRIVDAADMQFADANAVARVGDIELMRRAGRGIADIVASVHEGTSICAFAGPGNNGGDAFAACAELAATRRCTVYAMPAQRQSSGRQDAEARAKAAGVIIKAFPQTSAEIEAALSDAHCILDGILGVGARADTSMFRSLIDAINAHSAFTVALDLPTGIDADGGFDAANDAVHADLTIALGAVKLGLLSARAFVGSLYLVDIGITENDYRSDAKSFNEYITMPEFLGKLPERAVQADKRSAGAPLLIAGSAQFPGAAVLCAHAAARAGAGYVTVAAPEAACLPLRMHLVEQVVVGFDDQNIEESIAALVSLTRHAGSVAIGPGLGLSENIGHIVRGFISQTTLPLVIDASGLTHIGKHLDLLRDRPCIVTPHENEFARLSGGGTLAVGTRVARLREFVERTGITTLLKGNVSNVFDGSRLYFNTSGTSALATAGTGDVLSGIIATLLAQGLAPYDAGCVGSYWHGNAGRIAASKRSRGVVAGDLPELLADAIDDIFVNSAPNCTKIF